MKAMKTLITRSVVAVAVLGLIASLPCPVSGQSPSPSGAAGVKARVSSLIERFPADNGAARDALCADLVKLGPAGLAETFARVLPPGAGDDAKARFAVYGLAVYVSRQGAEAGRQMFIKALLAALASSADKQV